MSGMEFTILLEVEFLPDSDGSSILGLLDPDGPAFDEWWYTPFL